MTKPKRPSGLSKRGGGFWRSTLAVYELSTAELELLAEACRTLDVLDALEAQVAEDGPVIDGKPHKALVELRLQRTVLGRLLGQLALPDEDGSVLPSPASARARKAAQSRWAERAANG